MREIYTGKMVEKIPVRENTEFARNKMNTGNIVYPSCKFLILKKKAIVTLATIFFLTKLNLPLETLSHMKQSKVNKYRRF